MAKVTQSTRCANCKAPIYEDPGTAAENRIPCTNCGSTLRDHFVTVEDTVTVHEMIGLKGKRPGKKKPFIEQKSGDDLHRKSDRWMKLVRVIINTRKR
jgi:DNA-directed RNA polymerase subunit RPC12/RpoP